METSNDEKALFELQDARKLFFPAVSIRQTKRYATTGVDGVRIQSVKIGAKRFVSRAAVDAFVAALFRVPEPTKPRRQPGPPDADAYAALERHGVKWKKPDYLKN